MRCRRRGADPSLDKISREQAVIDACLERVRKYFEFAFAIPVKERDEDQQNVPVRIYEAAVHDHQVSAMIGQTSPSAFRQLTDPNRVHNLDSVPIRGGLTNSPPIQQLG
jgi:hypothetical protein